MEPMSCNVVRLQLLKGKENFRAPHRPFPPAPDTWLAITLAVHIFQAFPRCPLFHCLLTFGQKLNSFSPRTVIFRFVSLSLAHSTRAQAMVPAESSAFEELNFLSTGLSATQYVTQA